MPGNVALEDAECGDGALTCCGAAAANVGPRLSDTSSHASADRPWATNLASFACLDASKPSRTAFDSMHLGPTLRFCYTAYS